MNDGAICQEINDSRVGEVYREDGEFSFICAEFKVLWDI